MNKKAIYLKEKKIPPLTLAKGGIFLNDHYALYYRRPNIKE